jgi:hypothetical protein
VQLIPAGLLVTVPGPVVVTETLIWGATANEAVTLAGAEPMLKLQAPVPKQAPLQPANTEPAACVATRETALFVLMAVLVQVPEVEVVLPFQVQLMPPVPVTVPVPVPSPVTVTGNDVGMKSAVTDCAELMVTEQAPVPVQAPPQPLNTDPSAAVDVRVTTVPLSNFALQVAPQLIPAGELATEPEPVPVLLTSSAYWVMAGVKVAVTLWLEFNVTSHATGSVQAPLQPLNTEPGPGVAARLTAVPEAYGAEQVPEEQVMPAGELLTVPVAPPESATVVDSVNKGANVAVTSVVLVTVTVHVPVPVHAEPLQPVKTDPAAGVAVRTTLVLLSNMAEHVPPQVTPAGLEVTEPVPFPAGVTVSA